MGGLPGQSAGRGRGIGRLCSLPLPAPLPVFIVFDCPNRPNCPTPYSHKGSRVVQSWDSRFCKLSQLSQRERWPKCGQMTAKLGPCPAGTSPEFIRFWCSWCSSCSRLTATRVYGRTTVKKASCSFVFPCSLRPRLKPPPLPEGGAKDFSLARHGRACLCHPAG